MPMPDAEVGLGPGRSPARPSRGSCHVGSDSYAREARRAVPPRRMAIFLLGPSAAR